MSEKQLEFFDRQNSARVIPFPASARVGEARRVATIFANQRTDKARAAYWKRTITTVCTRLSTAGVDSDEVQKQLDEFGKLVVGELARIDWGAYQALVATKNEGLGEVHRVMTLLPE
ncbi:MAG: hypothetical protein MnENMB40S_28740 [Rhizobiaceae bacterium MnEN-MB40S]|nr:MAG: hypothetical protein MnENMB40S_28740 [Rhizobiaceae bacterium MnEN-MB40S]